MTASEAMSRASAAGINLTATSQGGLRWQSPRPLPNEIRCALAKHKGEILKAIQQREDAITCRIIERDLGMRPGSLTLWTPINREKPSANPQECLRPSRDARSLGGVK